MREEKKTDKVIAIYRAIGELVAEGADVSSMRVSDIAMRAGIGKGTTYEYFSSKEEMVIKAIIFLVDAMVKRIIMRMEKMDTFQEMFMMLMDEMEEKVKQRAFILKYLHMISDMNLCQQMREVLLEDEEAKKANPTRIIQYMIEKGKKDGTIHPDYEQDYLETTIFSRIISFVLYVDNGVNNTESAILQMKESLYEGLCRELA